MKPNGWRWLVCMLTLVAAQPGCRSVPEADPPPRGSVDMTLMPPQAGTRRLQLEQSQQFVYPNLIDPAAMPDYPPELLPLRLDPLALCVEVVISDTGTVSNVARRIDATCPDEAGPHEARFHQVLREALSQWSYDPAFVCHAPDGRPSENACAEPGAVEVPTAVRLSYAFHFSQQDGRPLVERRAQR